MDAKDTVQHVFHWEGGGHVAFITGSFNDWSQKIPMHRSGNDFTYIRELSKTKHAYKFIVDEQWRFSPDQPTVSDVHGNINNYVDLTDYEPQFGENMPPLGSRRSVAEDELYSRAVPDFDSMNKQPMDVPVHMKTIILNASSTSNIMPLPSHVTIDHLYCAAVKDGLMVQGVTQRFRSKFVTTVYYQPILSGFKVDIQRSRSSDKHKKKASGSAHEPSSRRERDDDRRRALDR